MKAKRKSLLWQIYPAMLAVLLLSLAAVTWYGTRVMKDFYLDRQADDLKARVRLIENRVKSLFRNQEVGALNLYCRKVGDASQTRITVIARNGTVLADSMEDPGRMENHGDRTEVVQAFRGEIGRAVRFSHTLGRNMLYVAVPLLNETEQKDSGGIDGVLRMSLPLTDIEKELGRIYRQFTYACLAIALLAAVVTLSLSRRITRPLERIRDAALSFAHGDFTRKIPAYVANSGSVEVEELVTTLNQMAAELDERISTVSRQHNELQAVFASMVEAVIAVDLEERILSLNPAAVSLLGIAYPRSGGRKLLEAIRNQKLSRFVKSILQEVGSEVAESEIIIREEMGRERILHARGTVLRTPEGGNRGALVVFDDITQLRKLENIRRDFVANVSHELKTPVTTIKGFVETLLDGALKDEQQAREFLGIVLRNVDRLSAIIEDLLMLSRLEQEDEKGELELKRTALSTPLAAAIDVCRLKAEEKGIVLKLDCPDDVAAEVNAPLLEQAVVNLIINAIKYSESGREVIVSARSNEAEAVVAVQDFGIGIAQEHLPRLFERFYRSDKARSRKLGGTGLGLAIVKHIVQAHGGRVEVDSMPGRGTVFTIRLRYDRGPTRKA